MEIRFISTLTPEDEDQLAPALLAAVTALLDQSALAYTMTIQTSSESVFHHTHPLVGNGGRPQSSAQRRPAFDEADFARSENWRSAPVQSR
jgi:hypothetical protein